MPSLNLRHQAADLLRAAAKMRLEREALARQQQELDQPPSRAAHDRDDLNYHDRGDAR